MPTKTQFANKTRVGTRPLACDWAVAGGVGGGGGGGSQATGQYEQTKATEMPGKMTAQSRDKQPDNPNVHAVMVPMSQPIGGWHVTSMTGRSRPTRPHHVTHDYTDPT